MKKITVLAASIVMGTMLLTACGGCSSGSKTTSTASASSAGTASSTVTSAASSAATPVAGNIEELKAADLVNPSVTVAYGDYAAMEKLSKDIQNGNATGTVISIDGEVINFARGMSYSVGEKDPEAGSRIGTTFVIVGAEDADYPSDKTHIKITGKVFYDENAFSYKIYTLPDFIEVVEE